MYVKHYLNIEKWAYVHKDIFPKIRIKIYQKSGLIQISSAINLIQYLLRWFIGFYFVFMYRLTILQKWEVSYFTDSVFRRQLHLVTVFFDVHWSIWAETQRHALTNFIYDDLFPLIWIEAYIASIYVINFTILYPIFVVVSLICYHLILLFNF